MNSQKPTDILKKEHKTIKDIIRILETCAKDLDGNRKKVDLSILQGSVELIKNFNHKYHRRKEENVLFKIIGQKNVLWGMGDVDPLLYEHDEEAQYVRKLADLLDEAVKGGIDNKKAREAIIKNIRNYCSSLSSHLEKEEKNLYPVAESLLDNQQRENILQSFEELENEMATVGDKERYENRIKDYMNKLGLNGN